MANEITIRGRRTRGVPGGYSEIPAGNRFITRYLKRHAETVYVRVVAVRTRWGSSERPVGYAAPAAVVRAAEAAWQRRQEQRASRPVQNLRVSQPRAVPCRVSGGAADLACEMFLRLGPDHLTAVFAGYAEAFGARKCEYARGQYRRWQAGAVRMSPDIRHRLLAVLPPHLDTDEKCRIVERIWRDSRAFGTHRLTLSTAAGVPGAIDLIGSALRAGASADLPHEVMDALGWLAADDARVAKALAERVFESELDVILRHLRPRLEGLLALVNSPDCSGIAEDVIELPGGTVEITLKRGAPMNPHDESLKPAVQPSPPAVPPAPPPPVGGELAPIENPRDLLAEAVRLMSPEKQRQLLDRAGEKALELQVKQREAEIDQQIVADRLIETARAARLYKEAGAEMGMEGEHRSEFGYTRFTVSTKPDPPPPPPALPPPPPPPPLTKARQANANCFVATACFGDYDHPTVRSLRRFRDDRLLTSPAGRRFVAAYYRHGPGLAARLDRRAWMKRPLRAALVGVAWACDRLVGDDKK